MKGLIYSWLVTRKVYFIVEAVLFVVTCVSMLLVLPLIDFGGEGDGTITVIANFVAFFLGAATLMCGAESLGKDLESMIKNRFADYSLAAGISKKSFADILLVRNLICLGVSLTAGFVLMFIYLFSVGQQLTSEFMMFVPCVVFFIHSVDYWVTPLVIKMKNAEKAGLALGVVVGFVVMWYMFVTNGISNKEVTLIAFSLDLMTEIVITALLAVSYIPVYIISLKMIMRGDVC